MKIKDLPDFERPYEKAVHFGVSHLSDAELIAIIIRTGTKDERSTELAGRILSFSERYPGLEVLYHLNTQELMKIKGVGRVKALQLQSVAELSKRMAKSAYGSNIFFTSSEIIASYFMIEMCHLEQEHFRCVFLDAKLKYIGSETVFVGSVNRAFAEPREVLVRALKADAVNIVLLHNHPSGDPTPSEADISVTKRIREAARIIGLTLYDHIIIGNNCYVSMKDADVL